MNLTDSIPTTHSIAPLDDGQILRIYARIETYAAALTDALAAEAASGVKA